MTTNTRKKVFFVMTVIAGLLWIYNNITLDSTIDKGLASAAKEMTSKCPVKIDDITTLGKVVAGIHEITHFLVIFNAKENAFLEQKELYQTIVIGKMHDNKDFKKFVDHGVKIHYIYKNEDGDELHKFTISK
jgi:hypothetical protein